MILLCFSALFFCIISVVILSSVIGVFQPQAATPRILGRLSNDVPPVPHPAIDTFDRLNHCLDHGRRRTYSGPACGIELF